MMPPSMMLLLLTCYPIDLTALGSVLTFVILPVANVALLSVLDGLLPGDIVIVFVFCGFALLEFDLGIKRLGWLQVLDSFR